MSHLADTTASVPQTPDWAVLRAEAVAASRRAYAPYSQFPVGAAALTTRGRIVHGCNVENAAYGVALCAECGLVSALVDGAAGGPVLVEESVRERLVALSCVDASGTPITPCGRCRQLLWEHAAPGMLVEMPDGELMLLADLLPHAFGADNLNAVAAATDARKGES